jgi:hypothetical protein
MLSQTILKRRRSVRNEESWRDLQSANIEFTMKRLREPIEG